jgi:hypothetical protein
MHEIRRNWNRRKDDNIESVHLICHVEAQHAPEPKSEDGLPDGAKPNGVLDQIVLTVRPPGVSQPLWNAASGSDFLSTR